MKISTIIVTYNATRNNWIYKCLNSLRKSDLSTDIIVVDNNSTDETTDIIEKEYPEVTLVKNPENQGFGKANNVGMEIALKNNSDYFFLLNQDAWVEPNTLYQLTQKAKENPDYGIISPLHLNGIGDSLDYNFSLYISPQYCKNLYSDFALDQLEDKVYESEFICAACWLLSKKSLETVGGFSPTFFHYSEDDNYVHRLLFKNMKIGVYPFSKIFHDRHQRGVSKFFEKKEHEQRKLILLYSNPLSNKNINTDIKFYSRKLLKAKLTFNSSMMNFYKEKLNFLEKIRNEVLENLEESKSNKKYIFLDYND